MHIQSDLRWPHLGQTLLSASGLIFNSFIPGIATSVNIEYSLLYAEDGETSTGKVVTEDKGNGVFKYTITITAEDYATCGSNLTCGIDVYYSTYINEEMASASYYTVHALGPKAE